MSDLKHSGVLLEEYAIMHIPDWKAWEEDRKKGGDKDD